MHRYVLALHAIATTALLAPKRRRRAPTKDDGWRELSPPATPGARLAARECPQRHLTSTSSSQVPARSVLPFAQNVIVAGLLSVQ